MAAPGPDYPHLKVVMFTQLPNSGGRMPPDTCEPPEISKVSSTVPLAKLDVNFANVMPCTDHIADSRNLIQSCMHNQGQQAGLSKGGAQLTAAL